MNSSGQEKRLIPLGAMAALLEIQPQDLRHEVEEGRLPAVRVGTKGLLFDAESVLRILQRRSQDEVSALDPGDSHGQS